MRLNRSLAHLIVLGLMSSLAPLAHAVPYASSLRDTGGGTWEFVLNADAENVTIDRDGTPDNLGALAAGRHQFQRNGATNFEVQVTNQTPLAPWTQLGDADANTHAHFEQTTGLVVNKDPSSEFFGLIYIANARDNSTVSGRSLGDGVYSLTADRIGVNLDASSIDYSYFGQTFDFDTTQAKTPGGWNVSGTTSSPWKMTLDDAGNLIVSDWSDAWGGIKYANPTLTAGGLVLATEGGPFGGVTTPVDNNALHGSIASKPYVTGSVGNGLTLWALDEDMHNSRVAPQASGANGNHVWRWDVGNATDYDGVPTLVIDTTSDLPTPALPRTSDNRQNWLSSNVGVTSNAHYDPTYDKWYLSENRFDGNEAGLLVFDGSGQLLWSSLQFAIDNGLDGNTGLATGGGACDGSPSCAIQDPFRGMGGGMSISPDGTMLYLQTTDRRAVTRGSNPYFGTHIDADPALQGEVLVIPLDGSGLPDIQVSSGSGPGDHNGDGTVDAADYALWRSDPGAHDGAQGYTDWVDNFGQTGGGGGGEILNMESISIGAGASSSSRRVLATDIVGNVYIGDSNPERLYVFTPGGATVATTRSDGTFGLAPFVPGSAPGSAAVPEPGSLALVMLGLAGFAARRRRA